MAILLRGGTLLPMGEGARPMGGDLLISGARITHVGPGAQPPPDTEVVDCAGCFVMPGLVQTHVHLVQTIFRGLAEDLTLLDWLRRFIWPLEAAHDEASVRACVRLGLLELVTTGTTTILDMGTTRWGDVVAEELVRSGIRARFGQAMMDTGEGVPPSLLENTRASLDASAALVKRWSKAGAGRIGYAYAPRFALSCTRELLEAIAMLAKMSEFLIHTHSNENTEERAAVQAVTGMAPLAYLAQLGLLTDRAIIAHGVHVDDAELALLVQSKSAVTHCPSSNLKLGSGVADVVRLRQARVTVGIGADGAACNNRLDGFEEVRMTTLLARTLRGQRSLTASDALGMATREGARALHLEDETGTLSVGKRADVVVIDSEKLGGPGGDAATRIVFGGGSRGVRDVLVDGTFIVRDGAPLLFDPAEVRARAAEALPDLLRRAQLT
ncbi:MAG TPA: amidohydrolase family protein [Candidatus Limnocylindria bacterium]|nr:amidohydrolase family protein [Candidatus Limnocylindria bacterium]